MSVKLSPKMEDVLVYAAQHGFQGTVSTNARTEGALITRGLVTVEHRAADMEGSAWLYPVLTPAGWAFVWETYGIRRPADEGRLTVDEALTEAYTGGPAAALVSSWLTTRAELAELERADHPDIIDRFGRVWTWKSKDLYRHCGTACAAYMIDGFGLPAQRALDNPNYDLCEICRDGRTRNAPICKAEWSCGHNYCAALRPAPVADEATTNRSVDEFLSREYPLNFPVRPLVSLVKAGVPAVDVVSACRPGDGTGNIHFMTIHCIECNAYRMVKMTPDTVEHWYYHGNFSQDEYEAGNLVRTRRGHGHVGGGAVLVKVAA